MIEKIDELLSVYIKQINELEIDKQRIIGAIHALNELKNKLKEENEN
jgi:hypothetical protein